MFSENGEETREIWFINRSVVVLRPKRPYISWANALEEGGPKLSLRESRENAEAFLIPDFEDRDEALDWLEENCGILFEIKLNNWHLDPTDWPEDRGWRQFQKWFDVEYVEIAWDLVDSPLSSDPPEPLL